MNKIFIGDNVSFLLSKSTCQCEFFILSNRQIKGKCILNQGFKWRSRTFIVLVLESITQGYLRGAEPCQFVDAIASLELGY